MKVRMLMCLVFFVSSSCLGGDVEEAISRAGLVETSLPAGDAWIAANRNLVDYVVANDAGQLTIKQVQNFRRPKDINLTFDGKSLIGTNQGEWGGKLSVSGPDGTERILIRDNIVQIIQEKDELFVFTGLAHMVSARGAIYKIKRDKGDISAEKVTLLPGAPQVVTVERNDRGYLAFLAVTDDGLLSFSPISGEMKMLVIDQFWRGLYPTSAQLLNHQLVIGMRSGVAVVSLQPALGSAPRVTKIQYFSPKA